MNRSQLNMSLVALFMISSLVMNTGPGHGEGGEIRFEISEIRNAKGRIACGLFDQNGWLESSMASTVGEIVDGEATCVFSSVEPGALGISAYHDENDNGDLDSNFLRIPKEGTAVSRNARGRMGPPRFEDAVFDYSGGELQLEAVMTYR